MHLDRSTAAGLNGPRPRALAHQLQPTGASPDERNTVAVEAHERTGRDAAAQLEADFDDVGWLEPVRARSGGITSHGEREDDAAQDSGAAGKTGGGHIKVIG